MLAGGYRHGLESAGDSGVTERASEHQVVGPAAAARAPVSDAGPGLAGLSSSVGNQAFGAVFGGAGPTLATGPLALGTGEAHDATLQGGLAAAARARNEGNAALG